MRVRPVIIDARGSFMEIFKGEHKFVQANLLYSKPNTFRGMHYQLNPMAQGKLIMCVSGSITDVYVDIRKGSKGYGKVKTQLLSEPYQVLYVPEGFAHGFYSHDKSTVVYFTTNVYSPELSRGIHWTSFDLSNLMKNPILSEKDRALPNLKDAENNYELRT